MMSQFSKNSKTSSKPGMRTEHAAEAAHAAVDSAAAKAQELEHKLRASLDNAGDTLTDVKATASQQFNQSIDTVERFAKERPLAATGIAFAAGILAAALLRR